MPSKHETCYTLVFVKSTDALLLGYKKRGFGKNKWNGYGGKVEKDEGIVDGAVRELHEESNLRAQPDDLNYLGFVVYDDRHQKRVVHIFATEKVRGDLKETEEMRPRWFDYDSLPYESMWPDSQFWLPLVLKNCFLQAKFYYKNDYVIDSYNVQELKVAPAALDKW